MPKFGFSKRLSRRLLVPEECPGEEFERLQSNGPGAPYKASFGAKPLRPVGRCPNADATSQARPDDPAAVYTRRPAAPAVHEFSQLEASSAAAGPQPIWEPGSSSAATAATNSAS